MFLGKFPQLQKLYTNNEITEGLNILSLSYMPKLSKSSLGLSFQRSHSQPSISYLERKERELRIVHRFQVLATIADSDTMNNDDSDEGLQFKRPAKVASPEASASKKRQPEDERPNTVFVGNISYRITARDLKRFFMKFGCVNDARVVKDHVTKLPRGIAFVTFENKAAATMAIEAPAEERTLDGREMRVFPAREKRMKMFKKELEGGNADEGGEPSQLASQGCERVTTVPNEEAAITRLNDDILLAIFSHLKPDDLYEVQHVCRCWKTLVARCWAAMRVLDFSNSFTTFGKRGMNDSIFRQIMKHCGANVRVMNLSTVARFLNYRSMELIAQVCCNLESLNLSGSDVTVIGIKEIAKKCNNLKVIVLSRCINVGEKGLWWLLHLGTNLTHIDISSNLRFTGKCFYHLGPNITILNMTGCAKVIEYGFQQIGQCCKRLTELTLDGCASLTNAGLQEICSGCSELRKLSISGLGYAYLSGEGIGYIGQLQQLRVLCLPRNSKVDDNSLFVIGSGCRQLEVLDVSACGRDVSDASLESFCDCLGLRSLNIGYLENVTNCTLSALAKVGRLEEVKAHGNMNVYHEGCHDLLTLCPRLWLLDVSGCVNVGSNVLDSCLQAVQEREVGPKLTIVLGGSGVDVRQGFQNFAHPLLHIDTMNLCIRQLYPDSYIPDMGLSDMDYYEDNEEEDWGEDQELDYFLDSEDPMAEFERENLS